MKKRKHVLKVLVSIFSLCMIVMFVNEIDIQKSLEIGNEHTEALSKKRITTQKEIQVSNDGYLFEQNNNVNEKRVEISEEDIISLTNRFMDEFVQETDDNNKVKNYTNKEELIKAFEDIATNEIVATFINDYYYEENNELYLIPTETPPWFIADEDYEIEQISNDVVTVTQANSLELYGDYTIIIEFFYDNGIWKISDVTYDIVEEDVL